MAIPILIPVVSAAAASIIKDKKIRKVLIWTAIAGGVVILYPLFKKTIQISTALGPVTVPEMTQKPEVIPSNATILTRLYSWGGLENFLKELQGKGIRIVKMNTVRKGQAFAIDPKAIVWLSRDGKTAYAEYITYV